MQTVFASAKEKMSKTISALNSEYNSIRAGRANPAVLDPIRVDYWGVPTPISQMAAVSVAEARILVIQPWDKSALKLIEKAIQTSDIGINPQNDGTVIRLTFPPLTEERRKTLVKDVKNTAESSKVAVRNLRRDALEKLKAGDTTMYKLIGGALNEDLLIPSSGYTFGKGYMEKAYEESYDEAGSLVTADF